MPQDNTYVTPTTPAATIPPVQSDGTAMATSPVQSDGAFTAAAPVQSDGMFTTNAPVQSDGAAQVVSPVQSNEATMQASPGLIPDEPNLQSDVIVVPGTEPTNDIPAIPAAATDIYTEVATKISESKNVLIALSSDPSVDELSAAIGISLYLDRLGKRATAIYSGTTPNALEFLKPEETFETTADTLQDFVIALNKDKADHLRYKLDGEYVKIYITPYRHRLSEDDLEFSYGDYNVDLVIALDVANGIDLDAALREHGRIMHDAVIINVTTGNPGKFGEIEWSDKSASSVSEMIATLLYNFGGENPIAKDEATAYLTGIVAATNRFANAKTTPATMRLSSKLMESGANQQLVSKNITPDIDNELLSFAPASKSASSISNKKESNEAKENDPTKLDIEHEYEARGKHMDEEKDATETSEPTDGEEPDEVNAEVTKKEHTLLDDLKAAEQSLAQASAETVPEDNSAALTIESHPTSAQPTEESSHAIMSESSTDDTSMTPMSDNSTESSIDDTALDSMPSILPKPSADDTTLDSTPTTPSEPPVDEASLAPTSSISPELPSVESPSPTIQKSFDTSTDQPAIQDPAIQDALNSIDMSTTSTEPIMSSPDSSSDTDFINPALANSPSVPTQPDINGVPEMSYVPAPEPTILPPPPAPPIGLSQEPTSMGPVTSSDESLPTPLGPQPAMQDQVYTPQASDPNAFKIPGL